MAGNPRKFSEKIALIKAKEAEANAEFDRILNEVSGITKTPDPDEGMNEKIPWSATRLKSLHILPYGGLKPIIPHGAPYAPFKTGSLPNINHSLQQQQQQMQQQQHHQQHSPGAQQHMSAHGAALSGMPHGAIGLPGAIPPAIDLKSAIHDLNSLNGGDNNRNRFMPPNYGRGSGIRPQRSRTQDHTSYSPYLTPHPLNGPEWKKFKSDSDIHGSVKQHPSSSSTGSTSANASGLVSPMIHRRVLEVGGNGNPGMPPSSGGPPPPGKFPEGVPFPPNGMMPAAGIFPPGMAAPRPMSMTHPANQNHHGSLPDLSNLGFNNHSANNNPHGPCSPPNDGYGRMVSTSMPPPDSPSSMRPNSNRQTSPLVGSPTQIKPMQGMPPQFQYFPVPSAPMHIIGMPPHRPPNANHQMSHSIPSQHGGQPPPPNQQQSAAKHQATLDKQLVNETIRRRISDKMLAQQQAQQFRQNSESMPSPSSPGSPAVRSPDSAVSHGDTMYALSPASHSSLNTQFTDQVKMEGSSMSNNQFTNGSMGSSTNESPFIHDHKHPPMKQHSIPNIVLTGVDDNMGSYHFDRELRQAMSMGDSFDGTEMFSSDEQFKTDLEPLDLEGLQMIEDPSNVLTDPATEDQLRLC